MPKPIKRHKALQPVSREHHFGLLLSWKIREGLKKGVAVDRIKRYTDWYWANHLERHFKFEEEFVFPILGRDNELAQRAESEHRRLGQLFAATEHGENLAALEDELMDHIRFEERVLFQEIQKLATEKEMETIEKAHKVTEVEDWGDEFWVGRQ